MAKKRKLTHRQILKQDRARSELTVTLIKVIEDFKSKEEPKYKITTQDVIHVFSKMIARRTE